MSIYSFLCFQQTVFYYKNSTWGNNFKLPLYHPRSCEYYYEIISLDQENKLLLSKLFSHLTHLIKHAKIMAKPEESFCQSFLLTWDCGSEEKMQRKNATWTKVLCNLIAQFLSQLGLPLGSEGKVSACNVGDLSSIPGLGLTCYFSPTYSSRHFSWFQGRVKCE